VNTAILCRLFAHPRSLLRGEQPPI